MKPEKVAEENMWCWLKKKFLHSNHHHRNLPEDSRAHIDRGGDFVNLDDAKVLRSRMSKNDL
jgi:hypothetical protein